MKNKTIIDIWNEVREEEKIDREAFEFLASQVDIDNFHQKMCEIDGTRKRTNKK